MATWAMSRSIVELIKENAMGIDRTFYAIVGIKASDITLDDDLIDRLRDEEVGSLWWVDSNNMSGGEAYIGIGLHSQHHHTMDASATEISAVDFAAAVTKATLELEAIGYQGEVKMYVLMAIS
jgi:hypothetical protein